jgi:hypothetical protein
MPYLPEKQIAWRAANKRWQKDYSLKANYGITLDEYEAMVQSQDGKCAICGRVPEGKHNQGSLHVDHDHRTKKVRGLLCSHCNRGLGFLGDSVETLLRAAEYLAEGGEAG